MSLFYFIFGYTFFVVEFSRSLSLSELQTQNFRVIHSIYSSRSHLLYRLWFTVQLTTAMIPCFKAGYKGKSDDDDDDDRGFCVCFQFQRSLKIDARSVKMVFGRFHRAEWKSERALWIHRAPCYSQLIDRESLLPRHTVTWCQIEGKNVNFTRFSQICVQRTHITHKWSLLFQYEFLIWTREQLFLHQAKLDRQKVRRFIWDETLTSSQQRKKRRKTKKMKTNCLSKESERQTYFVE